MKLGEVIAPLKAIEADLQRVEEVLVDILMRKGGSVRSAGETMFRGGGKRIRPALVLLASRLFGRQPEHAVQIAAAVEMVHGASLLHDDVIDETVVRRGRATVNALHGNRYTVLLGDFLLTQALEAVCQVGQVRLVQVVSEAVAEMTLGQILELQHQGDLDTTTDEYLEIIGGKTASLMAAGCMLGGLLAGGTEDHVQALGRYGRSLGLAFQVVDDVLDYWGDPEILGKPVGSDLAEQKYTLPFLFAMEIADPGQRTRFREVLSNGPLSREEFEEIVGVMEGLDTRSRSLALARQHAADALSEVQALPEGAARDALAALPTFLMSRDH